MSRTIAAALLLGLQAPTKAQAPTQVPAQAAPAMVLFVRDPSGAAVVGAKAELLCRPEHRLPALTELPPQGLPFERDPHTALLLSGVSDQTGKLYFARDPHGREPNPTNPSAGSGLVTTERGLGALIVDLRADRAQRLELQPMAAVTAATGAGEFTLFARAMLPDERSVTLQPMRGTSVSLPAGDYEIWAQRGNAWTWQRLSLTSGQTGVLRFDGPAQRLGRRAGAFVCPASRPEIDLFGTLGAHIDAATIDEVLLHGNTAPTLAAVCDGRVFAPRQLPTPRSTDLLVWPPSAADAAGETVRLRVPIDQQARRMVVFCLRRGDSKQWQLLASCPAERTDDGAEIVVPTPPAGDTWLLLLAEGCAPAACSWLPSYDAFPFAVERGAALRVTAIDENNLPIVGLAVEYTPEGMLGASTRGHSDARGIARLGSVLGPGLLRVSDERYANQELALAVVPGDGVKLTVLSGSALHGRVHWPNGKPAANVLVTLRDARGRLRPATRSMLTAEDGSFHFAGLPDDAPLVLFASAPHQAHTWSAKRSNLRAGGEEVELELRDEDPVLGPSDR